MNWHYILLSMKLLTTGSNQRPPRQYGCVVHAAASFRVAGGNTTQQTLANTLTSHYEGSSITLQPSATNMSSNCVLSLGPLAVGFT
jgi:hypothetical protein